jgi:hypothetical protein
MRGVVNAAIVELDRRADGESGDDDTEQDSEPDRHGG